MPWIPTTDFEEEVVNIQPHHDFIFGNLSEPEYTYPRPQAHVEYAATKKTQNKKQQKEYEQTGKMNGTLRVIQQVQLIAGTKPLGEQPCLDDWENNLNVEQETIGMMRYCGMGESVEQPFNQKVTIATHPVDNTIKVVQNGRRKVALFFDDNVFKFKEKEPDTLPESKMSVKTSKSYKTKNEFSTSELESDVSLNSSMSLTTTSFNSIDTRAESNDSFSSAFSCKNSPIIYTREQRSQQYGKLLEETALLSLDGSGKSARNDRSSASFKTAEDTSPWRPMTEFYNEDILSKKENWPNLTEVDSSSDVNTSDNNELSNSTEKCSANEISMETSSDNIKKRNNFLDRFIKSDGIETSDESALQSLQEPKTYAAIAKASSTVPTKTSSKQKVKKDDFPNFYTTRRIYALKRSAK